MFVYCITDTVHHIYMYYDTRMGHACMRFIRTISMPKLADRLLNYYFTLLTWLVVATTNRTTGY